MARGRAELPGDMVPGWCVKGGVREEGGEKRRVAAPALGGGAGHRQCCCSTVWGKAGGEEEESWAPGFPSLQRTLQGWRSGHL